MASGATLSPAVSMDPSVGTNLSNGKYVLEDGVMIEKRRERERERGRESRAEKEMAIVRVVIPNRSLLCLGVLLGWSITALEHPLQHTRVLAESGPQEFALTGFLKPVHKEHLVAIKVYFKFYVARQWQDVTQDATQDARRNTRLNTVPSTNTTIQNAQHACKKNDG